MTSLTEGIKASLRRRLPLQAIQWWRRRKSQGLRSAYAATPCFADVPVDVRSMPFFRRESFPASGPIPWLDRPDAEERIQGRLTRGEISQQEASWCREWIERGFLHLEGFHQEGEIDGAWHALDEAVRTGVIPVSPDLMTEGGEYEGRFQNLHKVVPELSKILRESRTVQIVGLLLGRPIHPFQTIAFFLGSQQGVHSDSIHMATYPEGYLVGAWNAAEDIHPDSGPLVYYPGSHRLPYYLGHDVGISPRESLFSFYEAYSNKYEPFIRDLVAREKLEEVVHTPKKGDLLLWHANLLHGGSSRRDSERSRHSIVCHYFARGALCYHDLSADLAPLD